MNTVSRATLCTVAMLCTTPAVVAAQEADFQRVDRWVAVPGARTSSRGDALAIHRGIIRTGRFYSDFVLRFEFRLSEPTSEGGLFVRSLFGYSDEPSERGYRIALTNTVDGKDALGRVSAAGVGMKEVSFDPVRSVRPAGEWQDCELQAERDVLTVRVNGVVVSAVQALDEFAGYIALQANRGKGIEVRNIQAKDMPPTWAPVGRDAHRASEPGVELPQMVKKVEPFYPREPLISGVEGTVRMHVVVEATGLVGDVRVVTPLHPDLDAAAIATVRKTRFAPATRAGQPVAVIVTFDVSFQLKK